MQVCLTCGKDIPALVRFCSWCGSAVPQTTSTGLLSPQSLLHKGRYLILKQIGKGGMAAVYRASDLHLRQRTVAIKEMSQQGLSGQELQKAIDAFIREAELLARLKHQHLPHIYEQFEDRGRRYLVMEFIEGETLEDRLEKLHQRGDHLPLAHTLNITHQLCVVLDYLHTQQPPVIFRDLKPANIMLNKQQQIYLIDFGIARLFKPGQSKDTTALGSPGYAPPEQYRQATSPRSDIYSLGATLHQMLTGTDPSQHPFYFQPFSINQPALERLVQHMVALDAKQRPASMQIVKQSLENIIQPRKPQQPISIPKPQKPPIASSTRIANGVQIQKKKPQAQQASGKVVSVSGQPTTPSAPSMSVTVHTVIAASTADRHLWISIREQLHKLVAGFPEIRFTESNLPAALRGADVVLLLLSNDFLASSSCMAAATAALKQHDIQQTRVLSIVLRPCAWEQSDLDRIKTIPEDSVTHLSIYAQEQRILEAAKEIRKLVAIASLRGKTSGAMNLLQWLLCQLYGEGRKLCPYFKANSGRYALQHLRSAGLAGIILHLIDLQQERIVNEYLIGPLNNSADMHHLLAVLAPSSTDPEEVQGTASRRYPSNVTR